MKAVINLISSNIRFDTPQDKIHAWEFRRETLRTILLDFEPHIIATQEGRYNQLKDLESLLPNFFMVDGHREWIDKRMYPSLYVNKAYIEVLESKDVWLSRTPGIPGSSSFESAFPRLCTWAKLKHKEYQKRFYVFNVHLDHVKESTRVEQIKVLIEEIKSLDNNTSIILCGDFNDPPEGPVRELIVSELNLIDPWIKMNKLETTSYHKFKGSHDEGARIDWILHSPCICHHTIELDERSIEGTFPSDHFPLKATLSLD